jgi:Rad3-related DNA helicase
MSDAMLNLVIISFVVNFSRVVPSGLLLFFPSYPLLESCADNWRVSTFRDLVNC